MTQILHGLPAAPGIGIGVVYIYRPHPRAAPPPKNRGRSPAAEWRAFETACAQLDSELARQAQNENTLIAELFAAHRAILQDPTLREGMRRLIFEERLSAPAATYRLTGELTQLFHALDDEYFAGRAVDVEDLCLRLLEHLNDPPAPPRGPDALHLLPAQTVLLAHDLTPSELTLLPLERIRGIGLANSTPTAHSAILAHSLGIPMICTLGPALLELQNGAPVILDGRSGRLLVAPDPDENMRYVAADQRIQAAMRSARREARMPAITRDGMRIHVFANANFAPDVAQAQAAGADGIGLLRTEYLFQDRDSPPSLEEQAAVYAGFARQVQGPLVVRALDAGGDKPVGYIRHGHEANPFLGLRGVRLLIEQPSLLQTQFAALQAAAHEVRATCAACEIRFLLPMISTIEEVWAVRTLLDQAWAAGQVGRPAIPLGIMIEVPSAALTATALAPHVDFFSIGTNDLAQYTLAVDRTNSAVARLADPFHPAVLRLIELTRQAAHAHGKPVAVCGEMAGDPMATPLLLGLGVTELSAPLPDVASVKQAVRSRSLAECAALAQSALACAGAGEVRALLAADQNHKESHGND